jgi:hypothetical protein
VKWKGLHLVGGVGCRGEQAEHHNAKLVVKSHGVPPMAEDDIKDRAGLEEDRVTPGPTYLAGITVNSTAGFSPSPTWTDFPEFS